MSMAVTPLEVLCEESTWGNTRDSSHLPAQWEDATAGSSPQKARSKQSPRPGGAHILQRAVPQKQHFHLTRPHRHSPCSLFYDARHEHMFWQKEQGLCSLRPSHWVGLIFSLPFYTTKIQMLHFQYTKAEKITINHMLFSFKWEKNKCKQECLSPP